MVIECKPGDYLFFFLHFFILTIIYVEIAETKRNDPSANKQLSLPSDFCNITSKESVESLAKILCEPGSACIEFQTVLQQPHCGSARFLSQNTPTLLPSVMLHGFRAIIFLYYVSRRMQLSETLQTAICLSEGILHHGGQFCKIDILIFGVTYWVRMKRMGSTYAT